MLRKLAQIERLYLSGLSSSPDKPSLGPISDRGEDVEAWKEVFGIEQRYKAKLCAENDGKAWLQQVIEERANGDLTKEQLLAQTLRVADRSPYDSANILRKPFLITCQNIKTILRLTELFVETSESGFQER